MDFFLTGRGETSHRPSTQRRSRFHPVARALMALREYQKSINLLIRKALFSLLVREICMKYSRGMCYYWESTALMALQESAEAFLVWHFADVRVFRPRAKRVTSFVENLQLARRIRGVPYGLQ
ncbi:histone H3-like centromeric protein A [Rhinoderma darwinii]|uniref:histone H3-like centromeric protein A n=1 Tax=Rhinoderma darwinii TaxID=43563 RepID=UPI003F669B79